MKLQAESVVHTYGERKVLTGAWLSCEQGEIVGLLGRNGSGKSTLLRIIYGNQKSQQAAIRVNNTPCDPAFMQKDLIAYLPQDPFLPPNLMVWEVIDLFLPLRAERQRLRSNPLLKRILKNRIRQLSGGETRYLEVQLLLGLRRQFLLLDEPFTGIEPRYCQEIMQTLQTEGQKMGIVITDHLYQNVLKISQRLFLLKGGLTLVIGSPQDLEKYNYLPPGASAL